MFEENNKPHPLASTDNRKKRRCKWPSCNTESKDRHGLSATVNLDVYFKRNAESALLQHLIQGTHVRQDSHIIPELSKGS